ncbi:hypothetical protein HK102_009870, partial [Quaeritorhiza haematococci]
METNPEGRRSARSAGVARATCGAGRGRTPPSPAPALSPSRKEKTNPMPAALDAILTELRESDRQERIDLLIDFSKNLPPLPPELEARRDAEHRVEECQSPVYLF